MHTGHARVSEKLDSWDIGTRRIHWPLGGVLTSPYAPGLRHLGLLDPEAQRLGRGGFGVAYKVKLRGQVSVLKLTRDPDEVIASWQLRGKQSQHIVHIYDVWSLGSLQKHEHWASWWVIHREYLNEPRKKDGNILETIWDLWKDEGGDGFDLVVPRPGAAGRGMRAKWQTVLRHETTLTPMEIGRAMILLDQISRGIQELSAVGIDWTDILSDNLLMDSNGKLRIADVGFGRAKRDLECEPPELSTDLASAYAIG